MARTQARALRRTSCVGVARVDGVVAVVSVCSFSQQQAAAKV